MTTTSTKFAAACVLGLALASRPALAQSTAAAEELFNDAKKAMDAKDYDTACKRFRESNRLDPAVGTMLNLAVCEELRGRLATSWDLFRGASEKLPPSDPRHDYAKAKADRLEPRLPHLTMTLAAGAPADTKVREGDTEYSGAAFGVPLPVDPGKHDFVVVAPGHENRTMSVELREGTTSTMEMVPGAESAAPPVGEGAPVESGGAAPAPQTAEPAPTGFGRRQLGFVLGGVGIAGLGVGVTAGILTLGKKSTTDSQCDPGRQICSQEGHDAASAGRTLAAVSTVGWIVGALGVGAGVYLILTSDSDKGSSTALQTSVIPGGAALAVHSRF